MAFPAVATTATTDVTTATTAPTFNLPASIGAGETLLAIYRCAAAGAISWPDADWHVLFDDATDSADDQITVAWRKATGSEGASITLTTASGKGGGLCWRITGAADPTVTPPEFQLAIGNNLSPNPPNLTPTGGAKDYTWFALTGISGEQTSPPTYPTNYGSNQLAASSGVAGVTTSNVRLAGASRELNAASEDPGTFTYDSTGGWTAATVVIHPAGATNQSFAATPAVVKVSGVNVGLTMGGVSVALTAAVVRALAVNPSFAGGAVSVALLPAVIRALGVNPQIVAGGVSVALGPAPLVVGAVDVLIPSAQTVALDPGVVRLSVNPLVIPPDVDESLYQRARRRTRH